MLTGSRGELLRLVRRGVMVEERSGMTDGFSFWFSGTRGFDTGNAREYQSPLKLGVNFSFENEFS